MPNRSTEDVICKVVGNINDLLARFKYCCGISLDITGAFDHAWWPLVLLSLREARVPQNLYYVVKDYLKERTVIYNSHGVYVSKRLNRGCPQGSNSGPLFWNLVFDHFLWADKGPGVIDLAYADDTFVLFGANSRKEIETTGEWVLNHIRELGNQIKLTFNPKKTMAIVFSTGRSPCLYGRKPIIKMGGESIQIEKQMRYLGVTLDNRLTWLPHAVRTKDSCINLFNALARVARATWGLGREAIEVIYRGAFLPRITYGAAAWSHAAGKVAIKRRLDSAQRCALLRWTKAYSTTSTEALQVIAGAPPVDLVLNERATLFQCRRGSNIVVNDIEYTSRDYELRPALCEQLKSYNRIVLEPSSRNTEYSIQIYTDGSRVDMRVGAAFLVMCNGSTLVERQFRLGDACSVYQAELLAIDRAVDWVAEMKHLEPIIIYSDSMAAVNTLRQFKDTNNISLNIKKNIKHNGLNIRVEWVKAHAGNPGNERVDLLAKEATLIPEVYYDKIPISGIKKQLRTCTYNEWQDRWSCSSKGRHTFWLLPCVEERMRDLNWIPVDYYFSQLYSGHCNSKAYLKKIGRRSNAECDCNGETQDINHLFYTCHKYEAMRLHLTLSHTQSHDTNADMYTVIRNRDICNDLRIFIRKILL
ncbi:uncharacterized protein LOC111634899 [Centruroides sculpturatus]|uniref:uncharacterized protein LOC111634899 n=1 Tax=Centruroides sculpturatus TaxID=218467 RepID=UPI000C6E0B95|nr:uncharacterized protein LOC111634899 [Centruroides sculpturatus]